MANAWIEFVKKWSKDKKMSYSAALKDPKLKAACRSKSGSKGKKPTRSSSANAANTTCSTRHPSICHHRNVTVHPPGAS